MPSVKRLYEKGGGCYTEKNMCSKGCGMKEKRAALRTKRLRITAMTDAELAQKIASETDEHLRSAYAEMLALSQAEPAERLFATAWRIERRDTGETIGDLCFKGKPNECGEVEIGYGVAPAFQGQGYASEAVQAALNWAFSDNRVYFVLADAEPGNAASKRVLEKLKFSPAGERNGLSLYEKEKAPMSYLSIGLCLGIALGMCFGISFQSTSTGLCIGMGFGLCFGSALDASDKKKRAELKKRREQRNAADVDVNA